MAEVKVTTPASVEDPAHIAAMVAKVDGQTPAPARPDWLPAEFETPEAFVEAYKAATAKAPEGETKAAPDDATKAAAEAAPEAAAKAAEQAVEAAGLNMADLEAKVVAGESISDSDYAALEKVGISRTMVDNYIEGQKAIGEQFTQRIQNHVGGADRFNEIVAWAGQGNLTASEIEAFNNVIDTGTEAQIKLALDGMNAKFVAAGGVVPTLLGGNRDADAGAVFNSKAELIKAMNDPRYSKDEAYRASVEQKLSRSSIF